ncbi:CD209 antigen-like protein C isoform X2 [Echinops telfairi]|uniref:CD209 antigen-like protein C isoform X2 n=1 Tax=Echinops telfairi TaxID=9371 RepID=A0AC55D3K3_ECHTE|nr:CD209 antigen-like protein C isoform X2 [Echinops telfairi]
MMENEYLNEPRSSEVTFWGQRPMEKGPGALQMHCPRSIAGCLARVTLPLLLLLVSLGLIFVLLVATQVQVYRIHEALQREKGDHPGNASLVQEMQGILQQLTWLNASLAGLCRPCAWNWEVFRNNCYFLSQTPTTWDTAASNCQGLGAQLVIIDSADEQDFLKFWSTGKYERTWIGLTDVHSEGKWHWVDNTPLKTSFWIKGEPNNIGEEDCVELLKGGWNDSPCNTNNFWICEKPSTSCWIP